VIEAPARQRMNARIGWERKNAPVIGALDRLSSLMMEDRTMCDGEGLVRMAMTPIGLAVVAGIAAALFIYARWLVTD
jgi:hypothetical protein